MSKKKSIFVTAIVAIMMAFIAVASNRIAYPVFVAIVSAFAALGFLASAIAFCKWLEKPSDGKEEAVEPPEVVQGDEVYDFNSIIDEVKRDAETEEK